MKNLIYKITEPIESLANLIADVIDSASMSDLIGTGCFVLIIITLGILSI